MTWGLILLKSDLFFLYLNVLGLGGAALELGGARGGS